MKNILVEKFQKKLNCGAEITHYRETILDEEETKTLMKGYYFKDNLWEEEN